MLFLLAGCRSIEEAPATWEAQRTGTRASLRGLSVVSDSVVWASGSGGTYLRTTNGGETWESGTVDGAEELDFRDVQAFDAEKALVASAGEPAKIFETTDGGRTWMERYRNETPGVFLDAMAFWDAETGIAFSDPIEGSFLIIKTTDGGATWRRIPSERLPTPVSGEAGFAASGTSIAVHGRDLGWIGTGGAAARVLRTTDRGESWTVSSTPMRSGESSRGIFSATFLDETTGVLVGGDYRDPENRVDNAARTTDGGATWSLPDTAPSGYRSCVAVVHESPTPTLIAVGPSGSDLSRDGGRTWTRLGSVGYHVVGFSPSGSVGWACGPDGRVAKLTLSR